MNSLDGVLHHVNSRFNHSDHSNIIESKSHLLKIGILFTMFIVFMSVSNLPSSYAYTLLTSIPVGTNPSAITFDPANGNVYVANYGSNTVSVINGNTVAVDGDTVAVNVTVCPAVEGFSEDAIDVVVAATIGSITTPSSITFDSSNTNIYADEFNQNSAAVISTQNTSTPTATTTSIASSLNPSTAVVEVTT